MELNKYNIEESKDYGKSDFSDEFLDLNHIPQNYVTKDRINIDHVKFTFGTDLEDPERKLKDLDNIKCDAVNFFSNKMKVMVTKTLLKINVISRDGSQL